VSILLRRARGFACAWGEEAVGLSQTRRALWFCFKKKVLAAAVDVFVDSGVLDGFGTDGAVDHIRR
jgi:hypothetical protein